MPQEDVRNWVAKVMIDALKQGASQGLLQEPEETARGAVAAPSIALTRLLMTMLMHADKQPRHTRTYVYRDSNEQMFRILKVSILNKRVTITAGHQQSRFSWHTAEPRAMRYFYAGQELSCAVKSKGYRKSPPPCPRQVQCHACVV